MALKPRLFLSAIYLLYINRNDTLTINENCFCEIHLNSLSIKYIESLGFVKYHVNIAIQLASTISQFSVASSAWYLPQCLCWDYFKSCSLNFSYRSWFENLGKMLCRGTNTQVITFCSANLLLFLSIVIYFSQKLHSKKNIKWFHILRYKTWIIFLKKEPRDYKEVKLVYVFRGCSLMLSTSSRKAKVLLVPSKKFNKLDLSVI